jgi:hypothetical protein
MRRAGFSATTRKGKWRRQPAAAAPPRRVQIFRSVVDDPVARAAPAPADIIIDSFPTNFFDRVIPGIVGRFEAGSGRRNSPRLPFGNAN